MREKNQRWFLIQTQEFLLRSYKICQQIFMYGYDPYDMQDSGSLGRLTLEDEYQKLGRF